MGPPVVPASHIAQCHSPYVCRRRRTVDEARTLDQGCIGRGGGTPPPPPPPRLPCKAPSLRPATVPLTPSASLNGICNR